ncbi:MAG TPA: RNA-binding protein [Gemmatimonadaceae bacterium]|jgi:RNA recognition motif-containing protein|nr:RNA-binding protein [Gemmatimonadaceae bacterium]
MKLHIGNLPTTVTDTELSEMITPIAPPTSLEIVKDQAGVSKGYAFAEFATDDQANAVITGMNGREVSGKALKLGEARPRKTSSAAPTA